MRTELKPNLDIVRELYPIVKKRILDCTAFWDNNPDEATSEHKKLEVGLERLTGKNISEFDLWEYWEADGVENLSFRISLPDPIKIIDFKKSELKEILTKIKTFENPEKYENDEILMLNWANEGSYYKNLLKINFKNYDHKHFHSHKDKNGNYFEYSVDEIIEFIWNE
ncbi:hypothetical protein [Algibacter sp. L1A34]|uniref:hypothetical protein n=1 Tax=Algibacter sp. L1A34 TaxID=2686365 RepID=UPI00131CC930|nr:hypothetical protein [Algibacter sp. L1A34]